jgi:hypothetical protein
MGKMMGKGLSRKKKIQEMRNKLESIQKKERWGSSFEDTYMLFTRFIGIVILPLRRPLPDLVLPPPH